MHRLYLNLDAMDTAHSAYIDEPRASQILANAERPLVKTHCMPGFCELPEQAQEFARRIQSGAHVVYVVRDGRAVMCSARLWRARRGKGPLAMSEFLRSKALNNCASWPRYWAMHVSAWLEAPNVLAIRYEDVTKAPEDVIEKIAAFLGLTPTWNRPLVPPPLKGGRFEDYWRRMTGNEQSTTIVGKKRGHKAGKWWELFSQSDRSFFEQEAGEALRLLGYETDANWVFNSDER